MSTAISTSSNTGFHRRFSGLLSGLLSIGRPVASRNMLFPLKTERDYATEAEFSPSKATVYTLPTIHSLFLNELMKCVDTHFTGLDFIYVRLSSPSTIPLPNRLLKGDVFCMIDIESEARFTAAHGYNVLAISDRFNMKHLEDGGDNSISIEVWHKDDCSVAFGAICDFLTQHKIQGEIHG